MIGLVLCGGKSSRMGRDKSRLWVQFQHGADPLEARVRQSSILKEFCSNVYFSCSREQQVAPDQEGGEFSALYDHVDLIHLGIGGPALGVLSAHLEFPQESLLVLACDMLGVQPSDVRRLVEEASLARGQVTSAVFRGGEAIGPAIEPLLSWWSAEGLHEFLKEALGSANAAERRRVSLFRFLMRQIKSGHCHMLEPEAPRNFSPFNTPESFLKQGLVIVG